MGRRGKNGIKKHCYIKILSSMNYHNEGLNTKKTKHNLNMWAYKDPHIRH